MRRMNCVDNQKKVSKNAGCSPNSLQFLKELLEGMMKILGPVNSRRNEMSARSERGCVI